MPPKQLLLGCLFTVQISTEKSSESGSSRLDASNNSPLPQNVIPEASDTSFTSGASVVRKRRSASPSSSLNHQRPVRRAAQEDFWTSKVEDIPSFNCSPWDFYERFLIYKPRCYLEFCDHGTKVRVMRSYSTSSYYKCRTLPRIQHKNFRGVYEMYCFNDKVFGSSSI